MINKITEAEINNIESNSVLALPNDPTGAGYKAERIKHAFIDPITGKTGSIVSVINRIIDNINAEPESVTISDSEPTEKVKGNVWVNFDGKVKVYNGGAWENKLDIVTSNELETQVSYINLILDSKASVANIQDINDKIPAQASINNKLADKAFVNSSVATATATFQGTYTDIADLPTEGVDLNDYAFVSGVEDGNAYYDRYKYTGSEWKKEYRLNNSSFTAEQWAAINSGITSGKISEINNLIVGLSFSKADKDSVYTKNETLNKIDEKVSQGLDALGAEQVVNKTTAISADSTDTQYPSAKAVYTLTNAIEKKVDENTKDINSLKAIVSNTVVTDTEVSDKYHTRKTADSLSIIDGAQTRVNKISGNTISSKNLIPYPYAADPNVTFHGVTFKTNSDGSVQINGTPDGTGSVTYSLVTYSNNFILPAGTYSLSGGSQNCVLTARKYNESTGTDESWIDSAANVGVGTLTEPTKVSIQFYIAKTVTTNFNTLRYPMLNAGSTALPYYQYFSGLKNAGFKSILSTGKNLVNTDGLFDVGKSYGGLTCSKNADGTYKLSGTATQHYWYAYAQTKTACYIPKGSKIYFTPFFDITTTASGTHKVIGIVLYDKNGTLVRQWNSNITSGTVTGYIAEKDIAKVAFTFNVSGSTGLAVTIDNIKFMLSYENTNVFEPYKSDGIACESSLDLAEFDYAVPSENKVYRQSETITFDGSSDESWTFLTYNSTFISGGITHAPITSLTEGIVANMPDVKWTLTDINSKIELPSSSVGNVTTEGDLRTYLATNNLVVTYKKNIVTTEDVSFDKADYTAYLNGSESVMQGDNNTGDYGAECTVDQNYYVKNEV